MKRIFTDSKDVKLPVGSLRYGASSLRHIAGAEGLPEHTVMQVFEGAEGGMMQAYGWQSRPDRSWTIVRSRTEDMVHFDQIEVLHEEAGETDVAWLGMTWMARGGDGTFWLWKWGRGEPCHALYAYRSQDGESWERAGDGPVFHDHDSNSIRWDERTNRFVDYQATYQAWRKRYEDNIGDIRRRVMHVRTSTDGLNWEPPEDVGFSGQLMPQHRLYTPDEEDPPELEFYRFVVFPYADRYVGMQLNYAPSPPQVNPRMQKQGNMHGPQLDTEWWISRDGFHWDRPHRELHASGDAPGHIWHAPVLVGGQRCFLIDQGCYGYPEDRLFYVESRANTEFSTPPFTMPDSPLRLNASARCPFREESSFADQSYIMVEMQDESCRTVEGYEASECIFQGEEGAALPLRWGEKDGTELAGSTVHLRFYMRMARIYALAGD